ncbi:hypothetical protein DR864_05760 [Runella rosea]|uniref:SGNH/GDSL hydrolase family protein n=1 Tax=Runella rosea TaxID=2259595 RepID=A0A344TF53_9BACT|nr:hypothetical protein [Runella rosea]AXE17274.1 hypothetical protein DR864_05760 [Runella rosea]
MRFFQKNTTLFAWLGYFISIVILLILSVIAVEFFVGNGDGIWFDYDLRLIGFRVVAWAVGLVSLYLMIRQSPPVVQNILLSFTSVFFVIYGIETVVGWIHDAGQKAPAANQPQYAGPAYDSSYAFDEFLGRKPIPNHNFKWVKTLNGKPVIDVVMHVDSFSRRITPFVDSLNPQRDRYALFFGCSFTYGDAVADNETIPYYFQKDNTAFQAYNYGFFGYSPRHMLARLQHQNVTTQVPQKQGFAVYTYIEDHVNRAIPSAGWIGMYDGYFPDVDESSMQTNGVYRFVHPLKYRFGMMLFKSKVRQHFAMDFPFAYRPKDYELTANLIKKSQEEYKKQFKNDDFYVVLYPDALKKDSPMIGLLKERGIKVIDFRNLFPYPSKKYQLQHDGHPNPEAHRLLMEELSKELKKKGVI